ncbi:MAG: hypothetical protein QGM50_12320 [Anaerolineae bacterium]|nr:hypothetical protein [Anaerolineae bacterium]MDK1080715.1 hypothetical protein [Anaerolineae bacterium]MDK1119557.1 hypothetical protein [Anaerolineae bacterium]
MKYILIGLGFATAVEVINMGILQGNWTGMIATLLIVYSIFFISLGFFLQRRFGNTTIKLVAAYAAMGLLGLVGIEWILIGTYPTGDQSLMSLFLFQYWIFNY